jgi:hypothetical protein
VFAADVVASGEEEGFGVEILHRGNTVEHFMEFRVMGIVDCSMSIKFYLVYASISLTFSLQVCRKVSFYLLLLGI